MRGLDRQRQVSGCPAQAGLLSRGLAAAPQTVNAMGPRNFFSAPKHFDSSNGHGIWLPLAVCGGAWGCPGCVTSGATGAHFCLLSALLSRSWPLRKARGALSAHEKDSQTRSSSFSGKMVLLFPGQFEKGMLSKRTF